MAQWTPKFKDAQVKNITKEQDQHEKENKCEGMVEN